MNIRFEGGSENGVIRSAGDLGYPAVAVVEGQAYEYVECKNGTLLYRFVGLA